MVIEIEKHKDEVVLILVAVKDAEIFVLGQLEHKLTVIKVSHSYTPTGPTAVKIPIRNTIPKGE